MKGFVQKDCAFAGHSLGEYSALGSMLLSVESPCNVLWNATLKTAPICHVHRETNTIFQRPGFV